ncbi:MAG: hypothetical protein KGI54_12315 [Pseudomonadota bacterium]|nr:hypothetical protein [Pseudomonadota bacterium]
MNKEQIKQVAKLVDNLSYAEFALLAAQTISKFINHAKYHNNISHENIVRTIIAILTFVILQYIVFGILGYFDKENSK